MQGKRSVKMVAGYAIGGGHVLHMICDLILKIAYRMPLSKPLSILKSFVLHLILQAGLPKPQATNYAVT